MRFWQRVCFWLFVLIGGQLRVWVRVGRLGRVVVLFDWQFLCYGFFVCFVRGSGFGVLFGFFGRVCQNFTKYSIVFEFQEAECFLYVQLVDSVILLLKFIFKRKLFEIFYCGLMVCFGNRGVLLLFFLEECLYRYSQYFWRRRGRAFLRGQQGIVQRDAGELRGRVEGGWMFFFGGLV